LVRKQKRGEVNKMEDKKETSASIWVWVIVIGATALLVAGFIIFVTSGTPKKRESEYSLSRSRKPSINIWPHIRSNISWHYIKFAMRNQADKKEKARSEERGLRVSNKVCICPIIKRQQLLLRLLR
jgi:flagellar basal body-associated protein FliL